MRASIRPVAAASISVLFLALGVNIGGPAAAQPRPASPPAEANDAQAPALDQMALTEKQIQGLLAAQKDIGAVTAKMPEQSDKPDPKIQAELEGVAKKNGFVDYAEFDKVVANVGLVLSGFDPQTKTYVGPESVIKKQIASLNADKEVPPLDKKKALAELEDARKMVTPIKYPANITLVTKYYDKLSEAMQED